MLKNRAQDSQLASSFQLINYSIPKRCHSSFFKSLIQMASSISPFHLTTLKLTTHLTLTIAISAILTLTALNQMGGSQVVIELLRDKSLFAASFIFPLSLCQLIVLFTILTQQIPKIKLFPSPPSQPQPKQPPPPPQPPPPRHPFYGQFLVLFITILFHHFKSHLMVAWSIISGKISYFFVFQLLQIPFDGCAIYNWYKQNIFIHFQISEIINGYLVYFSNFIFFCIFYELFVMDRQDYLLNNFAPLYGIIC